jgi:hypothetical protein
MYAGWRDAKCFGMGDRGQVIFGSRNTGLIGPKPDTKQTNTEENIDGDAVFGH